MSDTEEHVLVVDTAACIWPANRFTPWNPGIEGSFNKMLDTAQFIKRSWAECDPAFVQPIVYCVIQDYETNKYLTYQRAGAEDRLHGKISIGIGGHCNPIDSRGMNPYMTLIRSGIRELYEELHFDESQVIDKLLFIRPQGVLRATLTDVDLVHVGLVFQLNLSNDVCKDLKREGVDNRWVTLKDLHSMDNLETWSRLWIDQIY